MRQAANRLKSGLSSRARSTLTEADRPQQKPRARIESLADLIFGLALSVGAISLVSSPPLDVHSLDNDLATFGFSFLILITMWLRYTRIMSVFPLESRRVINLNIMLLFAVSVEPFLFNLIRNTPSGVTDPTAYGDAVSTLYALDLGAMFAILGGFTFTLADEERKLIPKEMTKQYRYEGISWFICGLFFGISALPVFFTIMVNGTAIRYYLWLVPLIGIWILRRWNAGQTGSETGR